MMTLNQKDSRLFMLAAEMAVDGIVIGDASGNITYANKAIMQIFEAKDKKDVEGKHVLEFVDEPEKQRALELSLKSIKTGKGWKGQFTAISLTGKRFPIELTATPITNEKGVSIAFIDIVRDITDRALTEEKLIEAHRKLEVANEKLLVVGGLVRHEIANKINTLNLNAYLARKNGEFEGLLEIIDITCTSINRALNFSRDYEMLGKEKLNYINVGFVFNEVIRQFPNSILQMINECNNVEVLADSLLRELIYNLVDNTIKYGKTTTQIKLSCNQDNEELKMVYEDDGAGIPESMKTKLFIKGFGKGTGLGLYLIKKTLEVYGWQITENGEEGKNARFEISIPKNNYRLT